MKSPAVLAQRLWARVRLCIQSAGCMLKSAHLLDQRWLGSRMALIAFAIGTACTAYIAYLTDREISATSAARLAQLAERARKTIVDRMTHDEDMLNGLAGMVNGRPTFTREEVRRYVATMPVRELSGALGYGFIRYLPRSGIDSFLAKLSIDGIPEFEIKTSGNTLDLFVIEIIEPYQPNAGARGFDIGSEAKRRAAATSSVNLDQTLLTDPIQLIQDARKVPGFLLLRPIYASGRSPASVAERWQYLVGWVYSPIRSQELFDNIKGELTGNMIDFAVTLNDGTLLAGDPEVLEARAELAAARDSRMPWVTSVDERFIELRISAYGQSWRLLVTPTASFFQADRRWLVMMILVLVCLASLLTAGVIHSLGGSRRQALALAQEMTQSLRAGEAAMRLSMSDLAMHRYALDEHAIVAITDVKGQILDVNEQFCIISGYARDELIGSNHRILNSGKHSKQFFREMYRTIAQGRVWRGEICNRAKNGSLNWVETSIAPQLDEALKPVRYIAIRTDITALRNAIGELGRQRNQLDLVIQAAEAGMFHHNLTLDTQWFSPRWRAMFGFDAFEDVSHIVTSPARLHPDDRERAWAWRAAGIRSGAPFTDEFRHLHRDGSYVWIRVYAKAQLDQESGDESFIGVCIDISAQKQAEQELLRHRHHLADLVTEQTRDLATAKDAAEAANLAKSEFLANMSHELRTPMHAIMSFARIGHERAISATPDKLKRYFENIDGSAARLTRLLNDLLDLSKIEAGKMQFDLEAAGLTVHTKIIVDELSALAAKRALSIRLQAQEPLPAVQIDPARFGQAVRNLIGNAIKFSPPASVIDVNITTLAGQLGLGDALLLSVADRGPGIPEGELGAVFDKFVQSSKTKTGAGGTGLGLAITREIITAHGGQVWAANRPGGGAIFTIRVPATLPRMVRERPPETKRLEDLAAA